MSLWLPNYLMTPDTKVTIEIPKSVLQALFDTLGALSTDDMGVILGRWKGMTPEIATEINKKLTILYKVLLANGVAHAFTQNKESESWKYSRKRGWI